MKRAVTLCLLCMALFSLRPDTARASHIAAIDLSLTHISNNNYMVRLVLYRDCSGVAPPATVHLTFTCTGNPALNFYLTQVNQVIGTGQMISTSCPLMPSQCAGGFFRGIQEYVYQSAVTLPPCNYWRVSWTSCCRNQSNTISNPTTESAYIEATLNTALAPGNSNPVFNNKPVPVVALGQTMMFDHGAVDPNGDSLAYSLVTPFDTSNTTYVNWIPPSSTTQPFPSSPPISLDPYTGTLTLTPSSNVTSPMAIRVEEWRNINGVPVQIGTVYRDMQLYIIAFANAPPVLSGMDLTLINGYNPLDTIFDIDLLTCDTAEFNIWGFDPDPFNPLSIGNPEKFTITWNNGIPQATFQIYNQATDSAYAHFYWKILPNDYFTPKRCFTVTITDYACPYYGTNTYTYCLHIKGAQLDLGNDEMLCMGENIALQAPSFPGSPQYIWTVNGMPAGSLVNDSIYLFETIGKAPGPYYVKLEIIGDSTGTHCSLMDEVMLLLFDLPEPDLGNDTLLYSPASLTLDAGPGDLYLWNTGAMTQTISVNQTGVYSVKVDGGNGTRCIGSDTIYVQFLMGIENEESDGICTITPNPTTGLLTLNFSNAITEEIAIKLHNHAGQCFYQSTLPPDHHTSHLINIAHLPDGLYLMKISSQGYTTTRKVVLTRL